MCKHVCQTVPWMAWPQAGNKTELPYHAWLCHWTHDNPSNTFHRRAPSSLKKYFETGPSHVSQLPGTQDPPGFSLPSVRLTAGLSLRGSSLPRVVLYLQSALLQNPGSNPSLVTHLAPRDPYFLVCSTHTGTACSQYLLGPQRCAHTKPCHRSYLPR